MWFPPGPRQFTTALLLTTNKCSQRELSAKVRHALFFTLRRTIGTGTPVGLGEADSYNHRQIFIHIPGVVSMWSDFGFGDGALSSPGLSGLGDSPEGATLAVLAAPSHWPRAGGGGVAQ